MLWCIWLGPYQIFLDMAFAFGVGGASSQALGMNWLFQAGSETSSQKSLQRLVHDSDCV